MLPWFEQNQFPLYLAPMAGFTDTVFRKLCKAEGADVLVSEFVMSDSINLGDETVWNSIDFDDAQRPVGIQIFGNDKHSMAEAANRIVDRLNPDFIDINFGCPSEKVTCLEAGASLLKNPKRLVEIAAHLASELKQTPVTAKIRLGWDENSIVAPMLARQLADVGVQALAIHGRTKLQGYTGEANWDMICEIAETAQIPIIGNGNIRTSEQVARIKNESKVSGVMIGRGALGYPWIFKEIKSHIQCGSTPLQPSLEDRWETILRYSSLLFEHSIRNKNQSSINWMRSKILKLTKDMVGGKKLRHQMASITHLEELPAIAETHISKYKHADEIIRKRRFQYINSAQIED